MNVLKFGGTSVANAQNINLVLNIVADAAKNEPLVVTVSAFSGITDLLVDAAAKQRLKTRHIKILSFKLNKNTKMRLNN